MSPPLITHVRVIPALPFEEPVCFDPEDDKFAACVLSGWSKFIYHNDKALLKISGYNGLSIILPGVFVDEYFHFNQANCSG